jgi:hypothetical protein
MAPFKGTRRISSRDMFSSLNIPVLRAQAFATLCVLLFACPAGAQSTDTPVQEVIGDVVVSGIAETRFNPTHGTVFFTVSGASFPIEARDVAVLINEDQLPPATLSLSRRIIAASFAMPQGMNEVVLRAWDNQGRMMTADTIVWAGDLTILVDVVDMLGEPVDGAVITARLANQRSVHATMTAHGGSAEFVNLPDESIVIEATDADGRSATVTLPASERRALLTLR